MYINFLQKLGNKSIITVHTNLFAKNRMLHIFATNNSNLKTWTLSDMHHRKMYKHLLKPRKNLHEFATRVTPSYVNFQQNRIGRSVKTVHTNLFAKIANCINLKFAIRILKKIKPFTHAPPPNGHSSRFQDQSAC